MNDRSPKETRVSGDGPLFEKFYVVLEALQNPYRNETMHFDATYTKDEAEHLFQMVRGLMKQIAVRMDQEGSPAAQGEGERG